MPVQGQPHYLIADSYAFFEGFLKLHPILGTLLVLVLFGAVLGILKRMFERIAIDTILFAMIVTAIILIFGSSLFTFFHFGGFHLGG